MSTETQQMTLPNVPPRSRAEYIADISSVTGAISEAIQSSSAAQWSRLTEAEQWSVGVVAHHACSVQQFFATVFEAYSTNLPVPTFSAGDVDANNASHAREFADVTQEEALACLDQSTTALISTIERLSSDQIASVVGKIGGFEMTGAQILKFALIGHLQEHLVSIQTTIAD